MSGPLPLSYYQELATSEYRTAPNFNAFLATILATIEHLNTCLAGMNAAFDLDLAVGVQLDVLGQIVGVSRTLPYDPNGKILTFAINNPGTGYVVGNVVTIVQGGASGGQLRLVLLGGFHVWSLIAAGTGYVTATGLATTGGSGTGLTVNITVGTLSAVLSDSDYRTLLRAKIGQNQWDGTIDSLYPLWQTLFPGGSIVIQDNQDMTANIVLAGAFSDIVASMINNGLIVPQPEGVLYNYVFPTLPMFGFDRNDAYVAPWDTGHWV